MVESMVGEFTVKVLHSKLACIDKISVGSPVVVFLNNANYKGIVKELIKSEVLIGIKSLSTSDFVIGEVVQCYSSTDRISKVAADKLEIVRGDTGGIESVARTRIVHNDPRLYACPIDKVSLDNSAWMLDLVVKNKGRHLPLFPQSNSSTKSSAASSMTTLSH